MSQIVQALSLFFMIFCFQAKAVAVSWTAWKKETLRELPKIPGWCSQEKAELIMNLMYTTQPKKCIEIGTFGGSTTYPIARSLQYLNKGLVYTVDAWDSKKAAEAFDPHDANFAWWSSVDMKSCFHQFLSLIDKKGLKKWCQVLPMTSYEALSSFSDASVDLIYIDGSLSPDESLSDATLSCRKIRQGGYIWLNDANREERLKAVAYLMERCTWIREYSLSNQMLLFRKD